MIDYTAHPNWSVPSHFGKEEKLTADEAALNKEGVLEKLIENFKNANAGKDATNGALRTAILDKTTTQVTMVKGVHQAKFFSKNVRDQGRIDQTHYQVKWVRADPHHIYVQPNLSQKWDVTEIT